MTPSNAQWAVPYLLYQCLVKSIGIQKVNQCFPGMQPFSIANTHNDCYCSPCGWKIPLVKKGSRMYTIYYCNITSILAQYCTPDFNMHIYCSSDNLHSQLSPFVILKHFGLARKILVHIVHTKKSPLKHSAKAK